MYICINKRLNVHTEEKDRDNVHNKFPSEERKRYKGYRNIKYRKILPHMFMEEHD